MENRIYSVVVDPPSSRTQARGSRHLTLLESHKIISAYKRSNFKNISKKFAKFEAPANINDESSFDNYINTMNSLIIEIIKKNVPKIRINFKSFPAWFSNELKAAIIEKKILHEK